MWVILGWIALGIVIGGIGVYYFISKIIANALRLW